MLWLLLIVLLLMLLWFGSHLLWRLVAVIVDLCCVKIWLVLFVGHTSFMYLFFFSLIISVVPER